MASLKNNGTELARIRVPRSVGKGETYDVLFSLRSTGRILVKYHSGWKLLDGYSKNGPIHSRRSVYGSPAERMRKLLEEPGATLESGAIPEETFASGLPRDPAKRAALPGEGAADGTR